jgi:hypothetical protein
MKKCSWFFQILLVLLVLGPIFNCNISFASSDVDSIDYIHFPSGTTIYSPLNKTYYSNFLDLNLTFGAGLGISHHLNYSIDGKYEGPIPLVTKFSDEFHIVNMMTGLIDIPELSDGSHFITINVLCRLNDYHGANPPGAPFQPTFLGSSNYIATWTHTIYFTIDTSNPKLSSSENWVEVTRFTENSQFLTTKFTIEHVEWRIKWKYEPKPEISEEHPALYVYVWDQEFPDTYFETILKKGTNETSGTLYIHNRSGTFSLGVIRTVKSFTLIIEQNINSIPEFPSWIIIPLFLIGSFAIVFLKKYGFRIFSDSS